MKFRRETVQDVVILYISGDLKWDKNFDSIHKIVQKTYEDDKQIILNLKGVDHFNSIGIGLIMLCYATLRDRSEYLVNFPLSEVPDKIKKILEITQMNTYFDYYDNDNDAITAVKK